jgi:hypothetical protein
MRFGKLTRWRVSLTSNRTGMKLSTLTWLELADAHFMGVPRDS